MISPVMKLARSEATKRIGPAISSAVAARPRGITVDAIFWPALVSSTGTDISVATQPGAKQCTRILCRASSLAGPLVKLLLPLFLAPEYVWKVSPGGPAVELMGMILTDFC